MHQYITGYWAASSYDSRGRRADHNLFISPDGSFTWSTFSGGEDRRSEGRWVHGPTEDVLTFEHMQGADRGRAVPWEINYVTGCEDSNCILVLRWLALASRNLPITFYRVHPPDDPIWHENA